MASERERFEKHAKLIFGPNVNLHRADGQYLGPNVQLHYETWQARARIAKQWTYCPECGSRDTASHDVLGSGSRVCADCGQDWWIDSDYTDVVRRNLEQWQEADNPTRIAEQREAELVEVLQRVVSNFNSGYVLTPADVQGIESILAKHEEWNVRYNIEDSTNG